MADVRDINLRSVKDKEIIEHALENNQIIVTRDTDFGEVLRYPKHPGAIIFRLPHTFTAKEINERLRKFLGLVAEKDIKNTIIIVELEKIPEKTYFIGGNMLSDSEEAAIRQSGAQTMYVKYNFYTERYSYNQVVIVVAGSDRSNTQAAEGKHIETVKSRVLG